MSLNFRASRPIAGDSALPFLLECIKVIKVIKGVGLYKCIKDVLIKAYMYMYVYVRVSRSSRSIVIKTSVHTYTHICIVHTCINA